MVTLAGASTLAPAADEPMWDYPVERGDTLIGLTQRLLRPGSDWRELRRVNRVRDPRRLTPGQPLQIPVRLLLEQAQVAEVLHSHGEVRVLSGTAAARPLASGANVAAGDVVLTGAQSSATLRFADGSRVLVRPQSRLRIERTSRLGASASYDTQLRLDGGGADTLVPKAGTAGTRRFEMRTPVASLGVRGTEFRTLATEARAQLEVLEGEVGMSAGDARVAVPGGQGTTAESGRVAAPRPLPPAPDLAGAATRLVKLPLSIAWTAQAPAARYRAQLFGAAGELVLDGLFDAPLARWADDLPDGRYTLRVRAVDAAGLEGRDASVALVLKARPEPPLVTAPPAAARLADETVTFEWTRHPAAARYRLQVADGADFASPRHDRSDLAETRVALALPPGTHHWRVASIRADGDMGPWGDSQSFERVRVPPPAPAGEPPQSGADGVTLRWAASPKAGMRYRVQVARDAAFTQLVLDEETGDSRWLLRQPEPGTYFVRTRSVEPDGFAGPFGGAQQFVVERGTPWWPWLLPLLLLLL